MPSLVSIIMPAYNAEQTLQEAVNSVLAQTWTSWELLLVVDCNSSDATLTLARQAAAAEPRIRLITDLLEGGCVFNRNHALRQAHGDFIAFLDSDDLWRPLKLEKQIALMERTGCDLSYTGYEQMDMHGQLMPQVIRPPERLTYADLLKDNLLGCLTAMVRRSRFPDIQFVSFLHEDLILWLSLLRQTTAQGLSEPLAVYRMAPHSRSGNKKRAAIARWRILRDFEHLPLHRAIPCFLHYALSAVKKRSSKSSQPA